MTALQHLRSLALAAVLGWTLLVTAAPTPSRWSKRAGDPFAVLDPQNWVNPDNMTWADYIYPPGTNWKDPSVEGSIRNFNIALVVVDYSDHEFVLTQPAESTIFGNPQPAVSDVDRADVPAFYRDFLNKPQELNHEHTLHEYWMEDSAGRYGVDLTSFGPYRLPQKSYEYGIDDIDPEESFNPGACPQGDKCSIDLRTDTIAAWVKDVGNRSAESYELLFILSAGQDESSTWQEFGEIKFQTRQDVSEAFGPPNDESIPNWAQTRYVPWSSWASAATIWPNAGDGSSTQGESSGMGTYAHELSHLLDISDNYNNPYDNPPIRSYTGPWSMLSRGSFNGPGGPHTRWEIPATQGGSLGSHHTVRDKLQIGLTEFSSVPNISKKDLAASGPIVAQLTARSVDSDMLGFRITMHEDLSPACDLGDTPFCDGGGYNNYDIEVIDRMGADSFTPDSGVMISKTKNSDAEPPFQWTIDANPQDIDVIDFYRPNGTASPISIGDYRQLADALFHAGTRSGSEFEYVDEANGLHFYIIDMERDEEGVLSYVVGVKALGNTSASEYGIEVSDGVYGGGVCSFEITNSGLYEGGDIEDDLVAHTAKDIYRLHASTESEGVRIQLANALATAKSGESTMVRVAVGDSSGGAVITLSVSSESDPTVSVVKECRVRM